MRWFRTEIAENTLSKYQVAWSFETIDFKKIDLSKSRRNNSRIVGESVSDEVVFAYAEEMSKIAAAFPAVVVRPEGRGFVVIDGNHRLNAFAISENDKSQIDAYVVQCDDQAVLDILTRFFNRTNGWGQSAAEAVQHCVYLLEKYPTLTQAEVCRQFGIDKSRLSMEVAAKRTRDLLERNGERPNGAPQGVLVELSRLRHSEPVLVRAAGVALAHHLSISETQDFVRRVRGCKSEAKMLDVIRDEESQRNRQNGRPRIVEGKRLVKRDATLRQLRQLANLLGPNPTKESLELTALSDYAQAAGLAGDVVERLQKVFG